MNGNCDFCPRPGRMATMMCVHEHRVGVWACAEKHEDYIAPGWIYCRLCDEAPHGHRHSCRLVEVKVPAAS